MSAAPMTGSKQNRMEIPLWATREFRWLLFIFVIAGACFAVLYIEIIPLFSKPEETAVDGGPSAADALRPKPVDTGSAPPLAEALRAVRDFSSVEDEDEGYAALIAHLSAAEAGGAGEKPIEVSYKLFGSMASELRGRRCVVTAMLLSSKEIALVRRPGAVEFVHRAYLVDPAGTEGYVVDLLSPPPEGLAERDLARFEGFFLKLGAYEGMKGPVIAPMFVARALERVVQPRVAANPDFPLEWLLGCIAILSSGLVAVMVWHQRRQGQRRVRPVRAASAPLPSPRPPPAKAPAPSPAVDAAAPAAAIAVETPRHAAPHFASRRAAASAAARRAELAPSASQRRVLLYGLGALVLLVGVSIALRRFGEWRRGGGAPAVAAAVDYVAAAKAARTRIEEIQRPLWEGEKGLGDEGLKDLRTELSALTANHQRLLDLAEATRRQYPGAANPELGAELLRMQLWILDAGDLLDHAQDPAAPPGFFVPFRRAAAKVLAAQSELSALRASPPTPPDRAQVESLRSRLGEVRAALSQLAAYLRQGLQREDLRAEQLPELAELEQQIANVDQSLLSAAELAAGSSR